MQEKKSVTRKKCNMEKAQREKNATWKKWQEWNMEKKVHKTRALECTNG